MKWKELFFFITVLLTAIICLVTAEKELSSNEGYIQYWFELPLLEAGVPDEEIYRCMQWAFGDDFLSLQIRYASDRWNNLHPLLFTIYDSDDRYDVIRRVGKAYLIQKEIEQ